MTSWKASSVALRMATAEVTRIERAAKQLKIWGILIKRRIALSDLIISDVDWENA
jgi:hypothetical protein